MQTVVLAKPGEVPESVRVAKMNDARKFSSILYSPSVLFAGITGSVSYVPRENDDVDMFIISRENQLWRCMFRAYLARFLTRTREVCLSLNMDIGYAKSMFVSMEDPLAASDSVHVIPVFGEEFYQMLLNSSGFISERYPEVVRKNSAPAYRKKAGPMELLLELGAFLILAPVVLMKAMVINWKRGRSNSLMTYRIVLGRHCLYFDNMRYNAIREQYYRK